MPKAPKTSRLSRVARRTAASDPMPPVPGASKTIMTLPKSETSVGEGQSNMHGGKRASNNHSVEEELGVPESQTLSRGQRKRQARRDHFLSKEKLILSSLLLQKKEEQKKRIDGLDAIKDALLNTTASTAAGTSSTKAKGVDEMHSHSVTTNKAKRKLVVGEVEHMNLILQHPAYKADPFQTMQEHLLNTFARDRKQQELLAKQRDETDKHKAAEKLKLKKERLDGIKKKNRKKYKPRRTK